MDTFAFSQGRFEETQGCRLRADPSHLDFDLVPIFSSKSKTFSVINQGLRPVAVNLIACHEQWLRGFSKKLVTVTPSYLELAPREITSVTVTVRPLRINIQNFYIIYEEVCFSEECPGGYTRASQYDLDDIWSKRLVDFTFFGDHATLKVKDMILLARNPVWTSPQCWAKFSIETLNECLTPAHHCAEEGTVPSVPAVSFRFPTAPIKSEESVAQILLANSTENQAQGHWRIYTAPPRNWKNFLNRRPRSSLDTTSDQYKDNPDLLSHIWAQKLKQEDDTENEVEAQLASLESRAPRRITPSTTNLVSFQNVPPGSRLFSISKTDGFLEENETDVITFSYKHDALGTHKMCILLRVYPAVFIWIDLIGKTLSIDEPNLELMNNDFVELHPVSVSDMDPPIQTIWLVNGGNVPSSFTVDTTPFQELKNDNYTHPVIECLTEDGTVSPFSLFPIKLRFSPLEMDTFKAKLRIVPEFNQKALEISIIGKGVIDDEPFLAPRPFRHPTLKQQVVLYDRNIPISLNPSVVVFKYLIPTGQSSTCSVFLTNLHTENTLRFRWPEVLLEGGGVISFKPESGQIGPREEVSCLITAKAGSASAVINMSIRCYIEDENEKALYDFAMKEWKRQTESTFFIDSSKKTTRYKGDSMFDISKVPPAPKPLSVLLDLSLCIGSVFGTFDTISSREKAKMNHPENLENLYPIRKEDDHNIFLSKFEREIGEEVISQVLWDIIFTPSFEQHVRQATRRQAPFYNEYKMSCEESNNSQDEVGTANIPMQPVEEIIDAAVFNLIQEMSSNFIDPETRQEWTDVPAVQPAAFVNVSEVKEFI